MMRAVRYDHHGGPEVLEVVEIDEPQAGAGKVRIRISTVGINPYDLKVIRGVTGGAVPAGAGGDFFGVIDQLGEGVQGFELGERVAGNAVGRALATYVVGDPERMGLTLVPVELEIGLAAALPTPARTAVAAVDALQLGEGDTVLIGGAAGGVGVIASQLAVSRGARVIGTASPRNHEFLQDLGVEPVEYGDGLVDRVRALAPDGLTAALDLHGPATIQAALDLGLPKDRIATVASFGDDAQGVVSTGSANAPADALAQVLALVAEGRLVVPIESTYDMADVQSAFAEVAGGHVRGKVLVTVA